jgi:hypothetical protein
MSTVITSLAGFREVETIHTKGAAQIRAMTRPASQIGTSISFNLKGRSLRLMRRERLWAMAQRSRMRRRWISVTTRISKNSNIPTAEA